MLLGSAALLLPLAEPVGQRSGAMARYLLAMAATAMVTPAQAQTTTTFVSNIGQSDNSANTTIISINPRAQQFETGDDSDDGYTLSEIVVNIRSSRTGTPAFALYTSTDSDEPGTKIVDLSGNSSTAGQQSFTPDSPTVLEESTKYFIVFAVSSGNSNLQRTASDNVDSGASSGWDIADNSLYSSNSGMSWTSSSAPVEIAVKGTPFTNTAPTVATEIEDQTATEGQTFSFAFPDTTFEDDDGDTLTYTATLDDGSDLPSWLMFDPANRSFSGTPQAGDGGTITVKVTATDSAAAEVSDEFDIKVGTACAEPNFGTRRRIWTGTVTVGEQENLIYGTTYGYGSDTSPAFGNLSDTDFEIGSNNYTIRVIYINNNLNFEITTPGPNAVEEAALKLHVCDTTAYDFSAAGKAGGPGFSEVAYYWSSPPDWSSESTRTLYLSLPANNAATGLPTITSSDGATVGDTLTANQGTIADSDGLPATFPEDYTVQWVREDEDGMNAEDISGETSGTYELADDDVGKRVRVRLSFTDQLSGMETVTSAPFPASGTVVVVDNTAPAVTITDVPATSNGPFTATITFSEPVGGFELTDIDVSDNATLSDFETLTAAANRIWTVEVTPTMNGAVTLDIPAGAAMDAAGNGNTAAEQASSTYTAPLMIVSIAGGSPVDEGTAAIFTLTRTGITTAALTVDVTVTGDVLAGTAPTEVTFGANMSTATLSVPTQDDDLDEDAGMVTATVAPDSAAPPTYVLGTPASASVTVNDNDPSPMVTLLLLPSTISEAAGVSEIQATLSNPSAVETRVTVSIPADLLDAVELDVNPPVLTILPGMTDSSNAVTLTAVDNDVEAPDLSVALSGVGSNTLGVTGPEPVTLTITDDDGTTPMDTTAPRVASIERQTPGVSPTNADSLTWRITFSETVTNVDTADFTVSGSTATVTTVEQVSGEPLAHDVTVSGGDLASFNGMVVLGFASDQNIVDEANNDLNNTMPTETNDNSYMMDNAAPMVAINVPATSTAPFPATISFNEVVSRFTVADITVSSNNATLSALAERTTTPGTLWTVLVTPTADGVVTLVIAAGVAEDTAGNGNLASPPANSTYSAAPVNEGPSSTTPVTEEPSIPPPVRDTTAPRVASIVRQAPTTSPTNADSLTWRVTFSETVANVENLDFTVSGSTASVTTVEQVSDAPLAYDVTVSGGDLAIFNGTVALGFASDQNIADGVNNDLTNTMPTETNDNSYMMDNAAPMVAITDVPATSTAPFTATITFNEVVSGFMVADITVSSNATLSAFTEATTGEVTPGTVWTVLVTPAADGRVTLDIGADMATDTAGNGNLAAAQARSTYTAPDTTAPLVTITDVPATSTAPFTATITFNEMVSGFTVADITVSNATLSDFTEATTGEGTTGTVWTVLVTPEMDGPVTLDIAAGGAEDAAGNGNTAAAQARSTYTAPAMETEAKEEAEAVLKEVILPEVVQQLTAETTEVITSRLNSIASGSQLSDPPSLSLEDVVADTVAAFHGERERLKGGSLDWRQALSGRDFVWPLSSLNLAQGEESAGAQDNHPFSTLALWGGGNYSSYRNIIKNTDVDGNGFSAAIGVDLQPIPRLVTGLALTTSRWGLDYATDATDASAEGTYEIGVTILNPYVNWSATEQLSLWATFGYGRGEVEQTPEDGNPTTRTDGLTSWAGGVRFEVLPGVDPRIGEGSPFGLAFKADGATSSFLDTQVQLVRLAAEVSHSFAVENGLLSAALDLGWRIRSVSDQDDTDGQQQAIAEKNDGGGAELAGHLNWRNTDGSVSATVDTRVLLGGGHYREWGIGGHLRFAPSRRAGEGLSLTLQPSFGVTGTRLDELWSLSGDGDLAVNNDPPGARLDAQLAYGFRHGDALLTPYTEVMWEEDGSAYGAGLRYGLSMSLELDLKGAHRSRANGNTENRLFLDVRSHL